MAFLIILKNHIGKFRNCLALIPLLFLTNCVMLPNQIKPTANGPALNEEAIVVFNIYGKGPSGMKEKYSMQSIFQEVGTEKYFSSFTKIDRPEIFQSKRVHIIFIC